MDTTEQSSDATQFPPVPDAIIHAIKNLYNEREEIRFFQEEELRLLLDTPFHKGHRIAHEAEDHLVRHRLEMALSTSLPFAYPFELAAAREMAFQSDLMVEIYDVLASGENCYGDLCTNNYLRFASPWTKLQFVLAADHYDSDSDTMGLVVGNAWKDGNGQGIMTANFDFSRCSRWLESSSERGLNAIHDAPKKKIGETLFRGGSLSPTIFQGMSWTDDYDVALFFANRQPDGTPVVLSTPTDENRVIVRYEHESEVILPHDPERTCEMDFV